MMEESEGKRTCNKMKRLRERRKLIDKKCLIH